MPLYLTLHFQQVHKYYLGDLCALVLINEFSAYFLWWSIYFTLGHAWYPQAAIFWPFLWRSCSSF